MKYKEWFYQWWELYVKVSAKERTAQKYRRQGEIYILPVLGEFRLCELNALRLQKFSVGLSQAGLSPNTVNGVISILKSSLKRAVALGVAERQFSDAVVRPKARAGRVTCFCKAEQKMIEQYVLGHNITHLFGILLCLYTGLRIGELLALTWDDVDFSARTVTINKSCRDSWADGHYIKVLDTAKTQNSERIIPLPRQIMRIMKEIKKKTKCKFVVDGRTPYGAQVRSYQRTFENLLKKLGLGHKGFHALRHTFATRALEVGMDVKTLAEILGHKNAVITLQRYAHSLTEHKAEMMNRLGRLLT